MKSENSNKCEAREIIAEFIDNFSEFKSKDQQATYQKAISYLNKHLVPKS